VFELQEKDLELYTKFCSLFY